MIVELHSRRRRLQTGEDIHTFLSGAATCAFEPQTWKEDYRWIQETLRHLGYLRPIYADRGAQGLPLEGSVACSSRCSGWCVPTPLNRASRVSTSSVFYVCQRHYSCGNGPVLVLLLFPNPHRTSPNLRRVGFRNTHFEVCSVFTTCSGLQSR